MKIVFYELEEWQKQEVHNALQGHEVVCIDEPLNEGNVHTAQGAQAVAFFIYSKATRKIIDQLPDLKLIATMSTGFDHIDVEYAKEKGIVVCNVPSYGENTVAEHTFCLILALSRKIYPSIKRTHEKHRFDTDPLLRGFDLKDKTLGIIGGGKIGLHVARIARGFDMRVLVFDLHPNNELSAALEFTYESFDNVVSQADILTLHTPYNEHTHHIMNEENINKMKQGSYLVNTARGGLIDTHALVQALQNGKVAGAGLDVLEEEHIIKEEAAVLTKEFKESQNLQTILEDHVLMKMDNVIVTPHNAFNSQEALLRILHTTVDNVRSFEEGNTQNQL